MSKTTGIGFVVLEGRDAGRIVLIEHFPFRIGRLQDNDLIVADDQVSRQHAQIEKSQGGYLLTDLKSRNGVFVDEQKVQKHLLTSGDRIRFGSTVVVFHTDISTARNQMVESIPDSPALAMNEIEAPSEEESTSIRFLSNENTTSAEKVLTQISNLFTSQLPPKISAAAILDIFYQEFAPERVQLRWKGIEEITVTRTSALGRNSPAFETPGNLNSKTIREPMTVRGKVEVSKGKNEERYQAMTPILVNSVVTGYFYTERSLQQGPFGNEELLQLQTIATIAGGILERAAALYENKSLKTQISRMEKHVSPEVARMISAKGINIEENEIGVVKRDVTVLFCDIQGFTPLSERLSAEDLAQLLNEYFQRMVDVIQTHHGHLNKFIGDAVMALFGAPESHGNDAENAVAAALSMIENLKEFWANVHETKRFQIRIGINTGKVVAGNIGSEKKMEYTVLGDAVNVASRLEGVSPPGRITIGPITAELVRNSFDLEEVPPVQVKGKSQSIKVFRVIGAKKKTK